MAEDEDQTEDQTKHENQIVDLSARIMQDDPDKLAFQHIVLCHLAFPRRYTVAREFERWSGGAVLKLRAGDLFNGLKLVPQPLPYGSIPRLVMIAAVTKAIQQKSPVVELGRSMSESLRKLGLADTGAEHWRNVIKQLSALSVVDMTMGYNVGKKAVTVHTAPFERIEAWVHREPEQYTTVPSVLEMSARFYESLATHSVPLDPRAVQMLNRYPLALDIYCWLAHRLYRIRTLQGERVPWLALREQFGQEISDLKDFKRKIREAIQRALMAYPDAKLDTYRGGLVLHASPPPIKRSVLLPFSRPTDPDSPTTEP